MKGTLLAGTAALLSFAIPLMARPGTLPNLPFGFAGPDVLTSKAGELATGTFYVTLQAAVPVEGWGIAIGAENARITSIDIRGTSADAALVYGFERSEITRGPGNEGAISKVMYSADGTSTLDAYPAVSIAAIRVEAVIPPSGLGGFTLRYLDGLQGSMDLVHNFIRAAGQRHEASGSEKRVLLNDPSILCGLGMVGFSAENVDSSTAFQGILGGTTTTGELEVPVPPGERGRTDVFLGIASNYGSVSNCGDSCPLVEGWALSVALRGDAEPAAVSFRDTAGFEYFNGGFERSEIVDPAENGGQRGFVTAVILCFGHLEALPPTSTVSVLKMSLEASRPQGQGAETAELTMQDGLQGSGQPVASGLYVRGESVPPCNLRTASLAVRFRPGSLFLRGNANNDSQVDISDSIAILGDLFSGGAEIRCRDAADANDDGAVDISDGIYLLSYLFLGGSPPPPPFPGCGLEAVSVVCSEAPEACY